MNFSNPARWRRLSLWIAQITALLIALALGMIGQAHAHTIVSKTNSTPVITVGGIATYQITVGSAGQSADSLFMRVQDTLPPGFAYRATQSIQFFNGSRFTTTAPTTQFFPSVGDTLPTWGRFDNPGATGAYFVITFDANVINPTCGNGVVNTAVVPNDPSPTTQHAVLTPAINQAPLNITGPPANLVVTKTTSTPVVLNTGGAGMQATYTITVSNSVTKCAATGVNITDILPPGFTYASTGAITFSGTPASAARSGGTDPAVGSANPTWTGFTIPGGGSVSLTFTANIAPATANGTYNNVANAIPAEGAATVSNFGPGAAVTLASANVSKQFAASNPATAQIGAPVPLTFTVSKPAGTALSGINFTDSLPAGLVVSGVPATPQCGGGISGAGEVLTVTGASLAAAATSCTITLMVVGATSGTYINSSGNFSAVGPVALSIQAVNATLLVSNATLTKTFLTPTIGVNGTSVLRFTLSNAAGGAAHSGLGFTDTLPAGLSIVPGFTVSQCGGTVASSDEQNISLSGASLAAGSTTCVVDVTVRSAVPGSYVNNSANVSGLTGGLNATGISATLQVRGTVLEKNFSPVNIGTGSTSDLTFIITNGTGNPAQTGLAFTETLPANVTLSAGPASPQCGGTVAGAIGGSTITFSGGSLALGQSACTISATVTSAVPGTYVNASSRISVPSAGMDITGVSATLSVADVVLTKQFANSPVNANTNVALVFTLTNRPGNPAQSGLAFTETLPANVTLGAVPASSQCGGTVAGVIGGSSITFSGGTMTAGTASCTLTVQVQGAAGGTYINSSANISGASANLGTSGVNAALQINGATLLVTKTTSTPVVNIVGAASGTATYTVTVQNTGFAIADGVQLTDTLPAGFTYAATTAVILNGAATRTAIVNPTAGAATPVWGTFSIPAGDSIAVTFNASIPNAQAGGAYNNSASVTSSTAGTVLQNFNGASSSAEDVTVQRAPDLTITKAQTTPNPVLQGQTGVQYLITVSNNGGAAILAGNTVTVTEVPPSGLTITALAGANWNCVLATLTCTRSDGFAAGASYNLITVTATVAANAPSSFANSSTVAVTGQSESNTNNNTGNAGPTTVSTAPVLGKTFGPTVVGIGQNSTLTFTITNGANNPVQSALGFTDTLPPNLLIATPANVVNSGCGGSVTANSGSGVITFSGGSLASGTAACTVTVQVNSNLAGSYLNSAANGNISGLAGGLSASGLAATLQVVAPNLALTKTHTGNFLVGSTHAYTLTVNNLLGTALTTGIITVTDTLPAGLTYVPAGSGGTGWSCVAAGQVVTCTSTGALPAIAAGGTSANPITINVLVGSTALPSVTNSAAVAGGGEPAAFNGNNSIADYAIVTAVPETTFLTDGVQTAGPGSSVFYTHQFIAGSAGSVTFSAVNLANPAIAGWTNAIYRDTNCNGLLDGTEGTTTLTTAVPMSAGAQICLIVKEFVPLGASIGGQDQITITAAFTPDVGAPLSLTRTDHTTVGTSGLTLTKEVRNVSTSGPFGANNNALPGQTLEYRITYTNAGSGALSSVVVNDATPAFTTFLSATCGANVPNITCSVATVPGIGSSGGLVWVLSGMLVPGSQSTVSFQVLVQP